MIWLGLTLLLGKLADVSLLAEVGWLWVLSPFAIAFIWFEFLESALGFDKRKKLKEASDAEAKRERIAKSFLTPAKPGAKK